MRRDRQAHGALTPALLGVCLLAACGSLAACGEDGPPWQASAAEDARELPLLETVPVVEMSREEFAADAAERAAAISDAYLRYYADTYGRMGFFDPDLDLRPIFAGSSSDWVGATYSPEEELITLVGDTRDDTIVHEWVHALQDQHFDLIAYDVLDPTDAFLARRAVVEGDAVLAQLRFLRRQQGRDLHTVSWPATFEMWRGFSDEQLATADYPLIFLDYVSFVYTYGLIYAAGNLLGVGPNGEAGEAGEGVARPPYDFALADALFTTRPPASTQAVLALDLTGEAVAPVTGLGLGKLPEAVAARLEHVDWDTLGAWYVHLLFHPLPVAELPFGARALAAAWNGDRADFVRDRESGAMAVTWATAWTSEEAAAAAADALWTLHGGTPAGEGPAGTAADGEALWIERRADRVVVIKNLAAADAAVLAEQAFGATATPATRRHPSLAAAMGRLRSATGCRDLARAGALLRARGL